VCVVCVCVCVVVSTIMFHVFSQTHGFNRESVL